MAARTGFLPNSEADLLAWCANFSALINATPTTYGLTAALASSFEDLNAAYAEAYQIARDPDTRTGPSIIRKDAASTAVKSNARMLSKIVEGTAGVTDAMKKSLGLTIRKTPTSRPAPATSPLIDVMSVVGRTVRVRFHADEAGRRGRPTDAAGAMLYSFVGEAPSDNMKLWKFETSTTKTSIEVTFDDSMVPGTQVWLTGFWFNSKMEKGPVADPVSTTIGYGLSATA